MSPSARDAGGAATRSTFALTLDQRHGRSARHNMVLESDFGDGVNLGPNGWRVVGEPRIERIEHEGEAGVRFEPPAEGFHVCRMEHSITAGELGGCDARLHIRLLHCTVDEAKALGHVSLSLLVAPASGSPYTLQLPIVAGMAPGWEDHMFNLRFDAPVQTAALRIDLVGTGARVSLARLSMVSVPTWTRDSSEDRRVRNAIPDGSFETRQPRFFASGQRRWPNGELCDVAMPWSFDTDAAVGQQSLSVVLDDATGRIGWSPIDLSSGPPRGQPGVSQWHIRFRARANEAVTLTARVATSTRLLTEDESTLTGEWRDYVHSFSIDSTALDDPIDLTGASLLFDLAFGRDISTARCWIDGVQLTEAAPDASYRGVSPVEIGIVSGRQLPTDLSNLWQVGEEVELVVRLAGDEDCARGTAGTLVVDVIDAFSESVATRISSPVFGEERAAEQPLMFDLPRGAYRVMATLWESDVGESEVRAHATLPIAVIRMDDPVPSRNRFGLQAAGINISQRTTHLGAGWVRVDWRSGRTEMQRGRWDLGLWQRLTEQCRAGRVELVPNVLLPGEPSLCHAFVREWLTACPDELIGVSIQAPPIAADAAKVYAQQVETVRSARGDGCDNLSIALDRSMVTRETHLASGEVIGVACGAGLLPEDEEATLSALQRYVGPIGPMWDMAVPVHTAGWPSETPLEAAEPMFKVEPGPVRQLEPRVPPAVSASRLVRAMLIRLPAGIEMTCCSAAALRPARQPGVDDGPCLHEPDYSPRPELVAFDWMAELLNDATFVWQLTAADGARLMLFHKDDGRAVLAAWRPFGQSATRVRLQIPRGNVEVFDCFGQTVRSEAEANQTTLAVNEMVQYLICPADQVAALKRNLEAGSQ